MATHVFRFGGFQLDPATRELRLNDALVSLPPKSFECLAYLIEHRNRAIGRDELISAVWGRVDASDHLLAQTLLRARRAIRSDEDETAAIITVPRFGYRWVAPVEAIDIGSPASAARTAPIDAANTDRVATSNGDVSTESAPPIAAAYLSDHPTRRLAITAIVGVLIALSGIAGVVLYRGWPAASETTPISGVAATPREQLLVLPVDVAGSGTEDAWIRLGAMDYVASRLRDGAVLKVLPSDQAIALVGTGDHADPRGAGELHRLELATGATYIVSPRAIHNGDTWQFALDVFHGGGVVSFAGNGAVPLQAAGAAVANFLASVGGKGVAATTDAHPALTELLQRIDAALLGGDLKQAQELVDKASPVFAEDPQFLLRAGTVAGRFSRLDAAQQLLEPLTEDRAGHLPAIRGKALVQLGGIAMRRQDHAVADRLYTQAIAVLTPLLDPAPLGKAYMGRGLSHGFRSEYDAAFADFARARVEFERAGDRIALASLDANVGLSESHRGRYAEAIADLDRAIATYARFGIHDYLAAALLGKSDALLALLDYAAVLENTRGGIDLEDPLLARRITANRSRALLATGQLEAAAALIEDAAQRTDPQRNDPVFDVLRTELAIQRGRGGTTTGGAEALLERIVRHADPTSSASTGDALLVLIRAALQADDVALAERLLAKAKADASTDPALGFARGLAEAEVEAARHSAAAEPRFIEAQSFADRLGQPDLIVTVGVAFARYAIATNDKDRIATLIGRLAPFSDRDYSATRAVAALYTALGERALAEAAAEKARALAGERDPRLPL